MPQTEYSLVPVLGVAHELLDAFAAVPDGLQLTQHGFVRPAMQGAG